VSLFNRMVPRVVPGPAVMVPVPVPDTPEYIDARDEARQLCRNLGFDVDNEHWDGAGVSDFVRLAYAQGWKACESRITSIDTADAIATAIHKPAAFIDQQNRGAVTHVVHAIQRAVAYGVPK